MTNEFLEQKIKELLYHFGEINWNILTTEAWDKYINNHESFNEKQFEDLRHFTYDIADDFAIGFAEWMSKTENRLGYHEAKNEWYHFDSGKWITTKELLEIYKKEKGL
jgi:hypothetical protein